MVWNRLASLKTDGCLAFDSFLVFYFAFAYSSRVYITGLFLKLNHLRRVLSINSAAGL
eukprot:Gb_03239 [translate_table: standard]